MSKDSERQAWTRFVEEREREAKRPRVRKRIKEEVSQAELEAELDDLITEHSLKSSGRTGAR
jgi:ParB-like chromosome segregation protein Spo0J